MMELEQSLKNIEASLDEARSAGERFLLVSPHPSAERFRNQVSSLRVRAEQSTEGIHPTLVPESVVQRPIFIGGSHKSGTTLLRNLLDGHPELYTLPTDGHGIRFMDLVRKCPPEHRQSSLLETMMHSLVMPIAGEEPTWIVGREHYAYPRIAAMLGKAASLRGVESSESLLSAMAWAYCSVEAEIVPSGSVKKGWVEKSTGNAEEALRLASLFPQAKFLHIVRHPGAIIAAQSRKQHKKFRSFSLINEMEAIHSSMRFGISNDRILSASHHIVSYEDLVANTSAEMKRIAEFLGIGFDKVLLSPSVYGRSAGSNTSRMDSDGAASGTVNPRMSGRWKSELSNSQKDLIEGLFGKLLRQYGYETSDGRAAGFLLAAFSPNRKIAKGCSSGDFVSRMASCKAKEIYHRHFRRGARAWQSKA